MIIKNNKHIFVILIYNILGVCMSGRLPWGKGVRVSTPFINVFQKKKAWNLPKSSTNLGNFKNCFFPPQNVAISKLFFFPPGNVAI
jgi:hypothetical protein